MAESFDLFTERFTERARKALLYAQEEAQRFNHNYIGTEHILIGLVREGEGTAAQVLAGMGVDLDRVRGAVEFIIGRGDRLMLGEAGLTPRAKKVLEYAVDEARRLGHHYVGTEHLLLGLVREREGIAVGVLERLGINLDRVRGETVQLLSQSPAGVQEGKRQVKTPFVDQLGYDLTAAARAGKLDPVIGRQKEIERVIQILSRRTKNNPVLVGDPGVGKTAIVEGLAQKLVSGEVPRSLADKRLLMLDMGSLVAGTMYRGQFEERLKQVIKEIKDSSSILFIDEIHTLVGAGSASGTLDAANILKPALSRGELQCIGATTLDDYRKYIERDAALERRFQPVSVQEPTLEETIEILKGLKPRYEAHHGVLFSEGVLRSAARLASRYVTDRHLPDKAIDLIDEAASRVRLYKVSRPVALVEQQQELEKLQKEKEIAVAEQHYELAARLRDRERQLRDRIGLIPHGTEEEPVSARPVVTEEDIAYVVSMWTGIPLSRIATEESERLLHMESALHRRIVGQEEAINTVARAVRRARAGLKDPKRPIGSFIFLGPTGVGKTELAKALAEFMFGSEEALIKIDMSEFVERHTVARLIGAPPGYVGYEEGGELTEAIHRKSYAVILFDEIEKAHPEVWSILLQILEDGYLTDARGRRVDFRNTIITMTSNIGAEQLMKETTLGFRTVQDREKLAHSEYEKMRDKVTAELKRTFKPELLNRIDAVVVFHALTPEHIRQIVELMLAEVQKRLSEQQITLSISESAKDLLVEKGFDPKNGARPMRRAIQNLVDDPLSEGLLAGKFHTGDTVMVEREGDHLHLEAMVSMETSS
ncbi:MAG: ATP-dependent Clp protease ATP-binding subunit [Chloroflexi bacterium]|nr:ATP-dependent Clp protease ATP-binding subunit [Chloroflexota bacterium]